jgi:hypothetical protein
MGKSIRQSARLVEEMSAELEVRAAAARELEEKAKEAEALAALTRSRRTLCSACSMRRSEPPGRASGATASSSASRRSFAGAGVSLLVTLLVHPIH